MCVVEKEARNFSYCLGTHVLRTNAYPQASQEIWDIFNSYTSKDD